MPINRVKKAIEEIKKGNMVVMVDDEDRENEGDLVYAATFSTPQKVNFMASSAKGLICVAVSKQISDNLNLMPMVQNNDSQHETAFTVSVDDKDCTTGISAYERDMTIKRLASYSSSPSDLVRPGHIFPLVAKDGGTLVRTGHTEGSVDLCRLSGVEQAAVICEIMKDDGEMARRDDLEKYSKEHNLHIVYISDIVEYRLMNESLVKIIAESKTKFMTYECKRLDFLDHQDNHHIAYVFGDIDKTANVKFHNVSTDFKLLSDYSKYNLLTKSIEYLSSNGGILIFLGNESDHKDIMKEYGIGAQILAKLQVEDINLLVEKVGNKDFVGISGFGLNVANEIKVV
jgi:3,4-dihydroxy 2-butanone 4-phosphate synthase/GTP cyclohydrolase II